MSNYDSCSFISRSAVETQNIAFSLCFSLFELPTTILLLGDLGAGKTTFAQGIAKAMGISHLPSPTFALENRVETKLAHLDLYRLGNKEEAKKLVEQSDDFDGIRLIEWPQKAGLSRRNMGKHIAVTIKEKTRTSRTITLDFLDSPLPSTGDVSRWIREAATPQNVQAHMKAVTAVADSISRDFLRRGIVVRAKAVHTAAALHDVLRYVDFKSWDAPGFASPTAKERSRWQKMKDTYGKAHEHAAQIFLEERGFPLIGDIISAHGAPGGPYSKKPVTTEQKVLCYADKRVVNDTFVTLDERFNYFKNRYSGGKETDYNRAWKKEFQELEQELFPGGAPIF